MNKLIEIRDLTKTYARGKQKVEVLHGVNLDVPDGEFLALMGPSGSGKTTLLNMIGGLDTPTSGSITVDGRRIDQLGSAALARWRAANVGFIFQFYNRMPMLSAQKNVELPLLLTKLSAKQRRQRAAIALKLVGLEDRVSHKPSELSGGQQQRVAIARAIVTDPKLLVCDEPTGDLDRESAESVLGLLQALNGDHGKTIVMVTHDPRAADHAGRVLHLDKGELNRTASGSPQSANARPGMAGPAARTREGDPEIEPLADAPDSRELHNRTASGSPQSANARPGVAGPAARTRNGDGAGDPSSDVQQP